MNWNVGDLQRVNLGEIILAHTTTPHCPLLPPTAPYCPLLPPTSPYYPLLSPATSYCPYYPLLPPTTSYYPLLPSTTSTCTSSTSTNVPIGYGNHPELFNLFLKVGGMSLQRFNEKAVFVLNVVEFQLQPFNFAHQRSYDFFIVWLRLL